MTGSADQRLDAVLQPAGWNLRGVLPAGTWDALVPPAWRTGALLPGARSAVVLASGGRALWSAFRRSPEFGASEDPLDAFTARVAGEAARALGGGAREVLAHERRGGVFADFVRLAREAGLGADSRLGLLLHPVYGPWLSIRAALLTPERLPPTPRLGDFDPCTGCAAPCAGACHGAAIAASGFQVARCASARRRVPACARRCDARRACVVGPEHAYAPEAEAHHMTRSGVRPEGEAPGGGGASA